MNFGLLFLVIDMFYYLDVLQVLNVIIYLFGRYTWTVTDTVENEFLDMEAESLCNINVTRASSIEASLLFSS